MKTWRIRLAMLGLSVLSGLAVAEAPHDTETTEQVTGHAMAFLFGEWTGTAAFMNRSGEWTEMTQTERVGPLLDGDVVLIEGRGYDANGATTFNALGILSHTAREGGWEMRSYSDGRAGTFGFEITETGFSWSTPAGPTARMEYVATVDGDTWSQTGSFVADGQPPRQTFRMTLTRSGDTEWPAGEAVVWTTTD